MQIINYLSLITKNRQTIGDFQKSKFLKAPFKSPSRRSKSPRKQKGVSRSKSGDRSDAEKDKTDDGSASDKREVKGGEVKGILRRNVE